AQRPQFKTLKRNMMSQSSHAGPLIGVIGNRYLRANTTSTIIAGMVEAYALAIEAAGGIPLLIYLSEDQQVLDRLYGLCAGLLFIGGEDVDPKHFGAPRHPNLGTVV